MTINNSAYIVGKNNIFLYVLIEYHLNVSFMYQALVVFQVVAFGVVAVMVFSVTATITMIISCHIKSVYCIFSVETYSTLINVTGLKHVVYNEYYQYWYDDHNVYLAINTGSDTVSFPTTFTEFGVQRFIPEALRPKERVVVQPFISTNLFVAVSVDGGIYRRSATGSSVNSVLMAYLQWHY